jgi:16S rRNA (adenine1518-N6/adenine1519-N6)-dimethyltransferase
LHDQEVLRRIADATFAPWRAGESPQAVVEIGPGTGNLTRELVARLRGRKLVVVEKDPELAQGLAAKADPATLSVVLGEAESSSLESWLKPWEASVVVGNLPYYAATQIYFHIIEPSPKCRRAVLMFQREVAERISAVAGSGAYGPPSVATALWGQARLLVQVPPEAFFPVPSVDSAVVAVEFGREPRFDVQGSPERFLAFVRSLFTTRRKTLVNSAQRLGIDKTTVEGALESAGLTVMARPEELTPEQLAAVWRSTRPALASV